MRLCKWRRSVGGDSSSATSRSSSWRKRKLKAEDKVEAREIEQSGDGRFVRKKMSPLRRKIAQQLVMAQHTAAILTTFNECDMSAVQELRRNKQDEFTKKNGIKLGLMSFC